MVIEGLPEVSSACTSQTFLPEREIPAIPLLFDIIETFCGRQARKQQIRQYFLWVIKPAGYTKLRKHSEFISILTIS